jgi:hypothetical protein
MKHKKSVLMTLNHNFGCFSGVGSGIAGNSQIGTTMHNTIERKQELDKHRDRIVMQYLKCGGRLYSDDYCVFGFDDPKNMYQYLMKLRGDGIVRGSIDKNFRKYFELKK